MGNQIGTALGIIVRPESRIGSTDIEILHIDAVGNEKVILERSYSGGQNWFEDILPVVRNSIDCGITNVIFELDTIQWINSTGIGALVSFHTAVTKRGGRVIWSSPHPRTRRLFHLTGLDRQLEISETFVSALEKITRATSDDGV